MLIPDLTDGIKWSGFSKAKNQWDVEKVIRHLKIIYKKYMYCDWKSFRWLWFVDISIFLLFSTWYIYQIWKCLIQFLFQIVSYFDALDSILPNTLQLLRGPTSTKTVFMKRKSDILLVTVYRNNFSHFHLISIKLWVKVFCLLLKVFLFWSSL